MDEAPPSNFRGNALETLARTMPLVSLYKHFSDLERKKGSIDSWSDVLKTFAHGVYSVLPIVALYCSNLPEIATPSFEQSAYQRIFGERGLADLNRDGEISEYEKARVYEEVGHPFRVIPEGLLSREQLTNYLERNSGN